MRSNVLSPAYLPLYSDTGTFLLAYPDTPARPALTGCSV